MQRQPVAVCCVSCVLCAVLCLVSSVLCPVSGVLCVVCAVCVVCLVWCNVCLVSGVLCLVSSVQFPVSSVVGRWSVLVLVSFVRFGSVRLVGVCGWCVWLVSWVGSVRSVGRSVGWSGGVCVRVCGGWCAVIGDGLSVCSVRCACGVCGGGRRRVLWI